MSRRRPLALAALAAAVLVAGAGCNVIFPERSLGERVWREHCASCHGLDGAGNTPLYGGIAEADLLDDSWVHGGADAEIAAVIREGVLGQMPPFDMLSNEEVRAVIVYLRRLRDEDPEAPR